MRREQRAGATGQRERVPCPTPQAPRGSLFQKDIIQGLDFQFSLVIDQ